MINRFDSIDIATSDLADAASTYEKNFDFRVQRSGEDAIIEIGDSKIRLRSGAVVADVISATGEGLAAVWLEADDVQSVADKIKQANIAASPIQVEGERRILAVHPSSANMVPLFIFDRR
jgi:predicted enzyme related to lactoylglutathione lyase